MKIISGEKTLLLLLFLSIGIFALCFFYVLFINKGALDSGDYYKSSQGQYGLTTLIAKESLTKSPANQELSAKKILNQNFTARFDNLGTIALAFDTNNRSINDKVVFRLKQRDQKDWYYQNTYNANQFQNNIPFPFGFPVISDSKNKSYSIQIESLEGKSGESLIISENNKNFLSIYKYSKSELINNPKAMIQFFVNKINTQIQLIAINEIILMTFIIVLPLLMYPLLKPFPLKIILRHKALIFLIVLLTGMSLILYRSYIFGGKLFLFEDFGSDSVRVSLPTYIFLFDWFRNGMPLWSDKMGIGTSVLSHNEIIFDPFTYILFLFGKANIIYMFVYMVITKIILAGAFFWAFLGKFSKYKLSSYAKIIGALTYAFGGYMIVTGQNYVFATMYVYLPLILLGFEIWLQSKKKWPLILMLTLTALYFFYFFYMTAVFFAVYAIFRYFTVYVYKPKHFLKYLFTLASYGLVAIGISAFYWLPSMILTLSNIRIASSSQSLDTLFTFNPSNVITVFSRLLGVDALGGPMNYVGQDADYFQLVTYAGIITALLVPQIFYQLSKKTKKPFIIFSIVLAIFLFVPFFSYVLNGFSIISYRWIYFLFFVSSLFLSLVVNFIFEKKRISFRLLILTAGFLVLISLIAIIYPVPIKADGIFNILNSYIHSSIVHRYLLNNFRVFLKDYIFIAAYLVLIFLLFKTRYKKFIMATVLALVCIELVWFPTLFINNRLTTSPDPIKNHLGYFDYTNEAVAYINSIDTSIYRLDKSYDSVKSEYGIIPSDNEAMAQNYRGLKNYVSNNQPNYIRFLQKADIFVYYPNPNFPPAKGMKPEDFKDANLNYINGVGNRYILQTFLGVKYYLTNKYFDGQLPGYFHYVKTVDGISIYVNDYYLPLGMTFDNFITSNEFAKLNNSSKDLALLSFVVIDDPKELGNIISRSDASKLSEISPENIGNIIGDRRKDSLKLIFYKEDSLKGRISVVGNKILVLTIPYDKGWTAYVDGSKVVTLKVENGLTGIKLSPGKHIVELKYSHRE
jgi:uncharacterized membrane protein YfhO